jgi:hypothetical protein
MAIVLDAYTMVNILQITVKTGENPMVAFIYAYYRAYQIRDDPNAVLDDDLNPEELSINLKLLPGIVSKKWVEKRKRLQKMVDKNAYIDDDADRDEEPSVLSTWMKRATNYFLPQSAIQARKSGTLPPQKLRQDLYALEEMSHEEISCHQLQRLLDEDATLQLLLGKDNARELIRVFKAEQMHSGPTMDINPAVNRLQKTVFLKLDQLEKEGLEMEARAVPQVRALSNVLDKQYSTMQKEWRSSLTNILEFASTLAEGLVELTQGLDRVQDNHQVMLETLESSDDEGGKNSGSD